MQAALIFHKLYELDFWHKELKFYGKIELLIRMRISYHVKHRSAIRLKFETCS